MKDIRTFFFSGLLVHPLFCLIYSLASYWLLNDSNTSFKGGSLFIVMLFMFWQELFVLLLWHIAARYIDSKGEFILRYALVGGFLFPFLVLALLYSSRLWQIFSDWLHQASPLLITKDERFLLLNLIILPILGLTITLPHYFFYYREFKRAKTSV